jgi:hypothetical protein
MAPEDKAPKKFAYSSTKVFSADEQIFVAPRKKTCRTARLETFIVSMSTRAQTHAEAATIAIDSRVHVFVVLVSLLALPLILMGGADLLRGP